MKALALGIDFGTTNSALARASTPERVELATYSSAFGPVESYRSVLYLEKLQQRGVTSIKSWSGPQAIEEYLAAETKGRLIQSPKSYLSSRTLKGTEVFGRSMTLEDLIARILRDLREKAEQLFGGHVEAALVGRPVQFVGAETEADNNFALGRLRHAFHSAGYKHVEFELEPVAAAQAYEAGLDHDELILIGDFGGGTSDFSLLHVGPRIRKRGRTAKDLLGSAGIGLAGDAFDAKIVRNLVSPVLGMGSSARSLNKALPAVPTWVYKKLEHWHHLSFLRSNSTMNMLRSSRASAFEPLKIEALIHLINEDLGYELHRAVQKTKCALSNNAAAEFRFCDGIIDIVASVRRSDFEDWIAEELARVESCVDALMASSGVSRGEVDAVFLTGGSSFVPAVRRIFETRFGVERIRAGNEFTSVARGLAIRALEGDHH